MRRCAPGVGIDFGARAPIPSTLSRVKLAPAKLDATTEPAPPAVTTPIATPRGVLSTARGLLPFQFIPAGQTSHAPWTQRAPAGQARPQRPQFFASVWPSTSQP